MFGSKRAHTTCLFIYVERKTNGQLKIGSIFLHLNSDESKKTHVFFLPFGYSVCHHFFSRFCMIVSTAYSGGSGGCGSNSIPIIITNETNEPSPMYGKLLLVLAWDELLKLLWLWLTDWHRPNAHFEWRARSFTLEPKMLNTNGCVQACESNALELFSFSSSLFKSNFNYWTFIQYVFFFSSSSNQLNFYWCCWCYSYYYCLVVFNVLWIELNRIGKLISTVSKCVRMNVIHRIGANILNRVGFLFLDRLLHSKCCF